MFRCKPGNAGKFIRLAVSCVFSAIAGMPLAQAQSIDCSVVLGESTIDIRSAQVGIDLINNLQSKVCARDFRSAAEAREYAASGGFDVDFFSIGLFGGAEGSAGGSSSRYDVRESSFCRSSSAEIARRLDAGFKERVGRFALRAFEQCIRITQQSGLWLTYEVLEGGQALRATLTRKTDANTPSGYKVKDLLIQTVGDASVECNLLSENGERQLSTDALRTGLDVEGGTAIFTCVKNGPGGVLLTLKTSIRDFFLRMPSQSERKQATMDQLRRQVSLLETRVDDLSIELSRKPLVETGWLACDPGSAKPLGRSWQNRQRWNIAFTAPFSGPPKVTASLSQIESYSSSADDAWAVDVGKVTAEGAVISLRGAYVERSLSNCMVAWIAVGR